MRLLEAKKKEDCLDGSMIYLYQFDEPMEEGFMYALAKGNKLQYFPGFSRPFFKIIHILGLQIKGILGDKHFEVVYPITQREQKKRQFEASLTQIL